MHTAHKYVFHSVIAKKKIGDRKPVANDYISSTHSAATKAETVETAKTVEVLETIETVETETQETETQVVESAETIETVEVTQTTEPVDTTVEEYTAIFGKAPHHKKSIAKMKEEIAEYKKELSQE